MSESINILTKKRLKMFVNKMLIQGEKLRNSCSTVEGDAINLSLRNAEASHVRFQAFCGLFIGSKSSATT